MGNQSGNAADESRGSSDLASPKAQRRVRHKSESVAVTRARRSSGAGIRQSHPECPLDVSMGLNMDNNVNPVTSPANVQKNSFEPKVPVVFRYGLQHGSTSKVKEVYLIGSFTDWTQKVPMIKSDCDFLAILDLPEGTHQYKFIADGKWECSQTEPRVNDGFNGQNNVVIVRESDFDVMSALKVDAEMNHLKSKGDEKRPVVVTAAITDEIISKGEDFEAKDLYTQEIPPKAYTNALDKPPMLPPHLTNIILNKDRALHYEPALLPEPNHVMLRHLYALSIREGVLVLSTTSRFKEKYVTTCFYKPIENEDYA